MSDNYEKQDIEDVKDIEDIRQCSLSCAHYDEINLCCWLASKRGASTDVNEDDYCLYGFREEESVGGDG